jgi:hypothetical protein
MLKWLWLSALVFALDQLSKRIVDASMQVYETIPLLPVFQLTYLRNQGAAFSFLSQAGGWQRWFFIALSAGAAALITYWLKHMDRRKTWEAAAWALVLEAPPATWWTVSSTVTSSTSSTSSTATGTGRRSTSPTRPSPSASACC